MSQRTSSHSFVRLARTTSAPKKHETGAGGSITNPATTTFTLSPPPTEPVNGDALTTCMEGTTRNVTSLLTKALLSWDRETCSVPGFDGGVGQSNSVEDTCVVFLLSISPTRQKNPSSKPFAFHTNHAAAILVDKSRFQGRYDDRLRGREVARGDVDATVRCYSQCMGS